MGIPVKLDAFEGPLDLLLHLIIQTLFLSGLPHGSDFVFLIIWKFLLACRANQCSFIKLFSLNSKNLTVIICRFCH